MKDHLDPDKHMEVEETLQGSSYISSSPPLDISLNLGYQFSVGLVYYSIN